MPFKSGSQSQPSRRRIGAMRLLLLRHASASSPPGTEDFARPLSSKGREAARQVGALMRELLLQPELVLCSTALRAQQTLEMVLPELPQVPEIRAVASLYLAEPA